MRRVSVVVKLWVAFTTLILIVLLPLELSLAKLLTDYYASQVTEPLLYHSQQLAEMLSAGPSAFSAAPMMAQMVGGEVVIVDKRGSPVDFPGTSRLPAPAPALRVLATTDSYVGQNEITGRGLAIVTAVPIPKLGGAVILIAPAEPMQRSLNLSRRYLWLAGTGSLLLGTGLALMLARSLLRPVIAIEQATVQIARGDFTTRVPVVTRDEIGQLASAVNQMTAQLEGFEKRRQEFLANVAHELRTPLSYIRGYAQAVAEGLIPDEERGRYLHIVQEESVRLGRLVDDLMDLAQMEEGQMAFDLQPLDLSAPIEQAVATIRPLASNKKVTIELSIDDLIPTLRGDGGRVQQVVFNLLDNGLRYTPSGGRLEVHATRENNRVVVVVSDTGPGIPAEDLPRVFERFHKRNSSGRGLGLPIVRSIVKAHGGDVGVDSEPGQGSRFWFTLPISG